MTDTSTNRLWRLMRLEVCSQIRSVIPRTGISLFWGYYCWCSVSNFLHISACYPVWQVRKCKFAGCASLLHPDFKPRNSSKFIVKMYYLPLKDPSMLDSTCEHNTLFSQSPHTHTPHTTSVCLPCSGPGVNKQYLLLIVSDAVSVDTLKDLDNKTAFFPLLTCAYPPI